MPAKGPRVPARNASPSPPAAVIASASGRSRPRSRSGRAQAIPTPRSTAAGSPEAFAAPTTHAGSEG
ncbi:MAG: hypothetical protein ACOZNI_16935, partial [Myxococcota bacterium]